MIHPDPERYYNPDSPYIHNERGEFEYDDEHDGYDSVDDSTWYHDLDPWGEEDDETWVVDDEYKDHIDVDGE